MRGRLEDEGITNGDISFLKRFFGPTLVPLELDIKRSLNFFKFIPIDDLDIHNSY
jgi:hypothetical protein